MPQFYPTLARAFGSAVLWSWVFNFLRLGSGLLLLPLLLHAVTKEELGVYYMFLAVGQFAVVIDFGFSGTIARFVSYAMSGAEKLSAHGVSAAGGRGQPNWPLLWELLHTTRVLYRLLALGSVALLAALGTPFIAVSVAETPRPALTWLAWGLTVAAAAAELYSSWWNVYLASMNKVGPSNRILVAVYSAKLALSCVLLVFGAGLAAVPVASLASSMLQRILSRRACLQTLGAGEPAGARRRWREHLAVLWPNTWRLGLQLTSRFMATQMTVLICAAVLGTVVTGKLGISVQMFAIVQSMAMVWTGVKWPLVGQLRARNDLAALQRLLWPRVWLQNCSYVLGALAVILLGPEALRWIGTDKEMIASQWLVFLALNGFLETQFQIWGTLISTQNRLPYLWPSVAANLGSLALAVALFYGTALGVGAFVLGPLLTGILFNYWYWPMEGARSIETTLVRFLLSPPRPN